MTIVLAVKSRFLAGQVWRIGPRYAGAGQYAHDNGTGEVVRLIRPLVGGADWYATRDLRGGVDASWDWIIHESRLERGELVQEVRVMTKEELDDLETRGMWAGKEPPEQKPRKFLIIGHVTSPKLERAKEVAKECRLWCSRQSARSYAFKVSGVSLPTELEAQFRAPHHSVSVEQLTGSLRGHQWRPGELARAHGGVLLVDAAPDWPPLSLDAIDRAWRGKAVDLCTGDGRQRLIIPTEFDLVLTMTPCPCGWRGNVRQPCKCTDKQVARWFDRVAKIAEGAERIEL